DADFVSLGGDSLKLMGLSLEIERVFRRRLPREEFLADATLHHLAAWLGIEQSAPVPSRPGGLYVRCVWPARPPSRGIALAMPGYFGKAIAIPFARAGLFPGHDVWAADYPLRGGCLRASQQWWRAALALVEKIQAGAIPAPRIVFGASFGGGLAWLVSRLLAGTPQCPERVVLVDAPPLHRLPGFRPRKALQALARVSHLEPPPTLHLRRGPLAQGGLASSSADQWQAADRIHRVIDLPTVVHLEMAQQEVLAQAAPVVHAFLVGPCDGPTFRVPAADTLGARLHRALSGEVTLTSEAVESLLGQAPQPTMGELLIAFLHLAGRLGRRDLVRKLIGAAVEAHPRSKLAHFAHYRLPRRVGLLCPGDMPKMLPGRLAEFDQALAVSIEQPGVPAARLPRYLCLAY
ncbi:MAG: phosphopantetheine-binding protein, partial [Verrucomicrobiota bacterium]